MPIDPTSKTESLLPQLILEQAKRTPHAVAVRAGTEHTYADLLGRAGAVAERLRALGVGAEDRIAVYAPRCVGTLAGLLGCWLAGAAYVPLDPRWPVSRVQEVVADCSPVTTLTDLEGAEIPGGPTCDLSVTPLPLAQVRCDAVPADALAHVLYTSGSSGRPKGVLTTHRNIAAFVTRVGEWAPGVGPHMCTAGVASWGFDAATYDLFVPLLHGGSIGLVPDEERADPSRLQHALARHTCTFGFFTPTLLSLLDPTAVPTLRTLILGGEPVPAAQAAAWAADPDRVVFDAYGPTEATVSQTAVQVTPEHRDPMPIGHDLPGQRTHVLDQDLRAVADGATGELCIGGVGVARGYQSLPGRTATAFVPDPFGPAGARMYRTGDLVRREPDGSLTYLGRLDDQVKIRGQRVEPGELASTLRQLPRVRDVAVVSTELGSDTALVAFVAPAGLDTDDVRAFAAERLPEALVPSKVIAIDNLPIAPTGKIDRNALRERLVRDDLNNSPPRTPAALWQELLGEPATHDCDFFASGGHSISAMRLANGIRELSGRNITVDDIYRCRTFGALERSVAAAAPLADRLPENAAPVPTSAQRRLWLVERLSRRGASSYNVSFAARIGPGLDTDRLERALTRLEEAHDVLRWRFVETPDGPRIEVSPARAVKVPVRECADGDLSDVLASTGAQQLSLDEPYPWRATLLRTSAETYVLALTFHHCVIDGWSEQALFDQLARAYSDPEQPLERGRFADYTAWRHARDARDLPADLDWWATHLDGAPDVLELPHDRDRPTEPSERAGRVRRFIDAASADTVRATAVDLGTTPASVVLASLAIALRRLTGCHDLLVAAMRTDRPFHELESSLGFYIDMQPVRLRVDDDESAGRLIERTHQEVLAGAAHPAAGVQDLVSALKARREAGRQPLLQIAYNVYNFPQATPSLDGLQVERLEVAPAGSPFDLTVYLAENGGAMRIEIVYSADIFERSRMHDMLSSLVDVIVDGTAKPDQPVSMVSGIFRTDTTAVSVDRVVADATGPASPQNETEARVAQIWCDVLQVDSVPVTTNFFDAGGSSLAISQVHRRLHIDLERDIPVVALFQHPTVRALARYLDGATTDAALQRATTIAAARRARSRRRSRP